MIILPKTKRKIYVRFLHILSELFVNKHKTPIKKHFFATFPVIFAPKFVLGKTFFAVLIDICQLKNYNSY